MQRREGFVLAGLLALLALLYTATLQPGHAWGDDFAQYLLHARNIAAGRAYSDTGYIYNRSVPDLGPRAYPPVFPLLLAPVYALSHGSLWWMKFEVAWLLIALLAVVYAAFRHMLSARESVALILFLGLNPAFAAFKDSILSDAAFAVFTCLCLALAQRGAGPVPLALAFCLAFGARTVGIVLLPAVCAHMLLRDRRVTGRLLVFAAIACAAVLLQIFFSRGSRDYLDQAPFTAATVFVNLHVYVSALVEFWGGGVSPVLGRSLLAISAALAALGLWANRRLGVFEIFALFYIPVILAWRANQGLRFLLPLLPLYLAYAILGSRRVGQASRPVLAALLLTLYTAGWAHDLRHPPPPGIEAAAAQDLFRYVRTALQPDARILFRKPRALALETGRASSVYPLAASPDVLWRYARDIHAAYLVIGDMPIGDFRGDLPYLENFVRASADRVTLVYRNPEFRVYRIAIPENALHPLRTPGGAAAPPARSASSQTPSP